MPIGRIKILAELSSFAALLAFLGVNLALISVALSAAGTSAAIVCR